MKSKPLYYFSMFTIFLAFCLLLYVGYLFFLDGNTPVIYADHPMKARVENGSVIVTVEYCRYSHLPFTLYASYVDTFVYNFPPEKIAGSETKCGVINRVWPLPRELHEGTYHLEVKAEFEVNVFKTVVVSYTSENFTVKKPFGG